MTALVKNTIRALAYESDSPAAVISKANAAIFKATPASVFVTLLFCVLDVASGHLAYCSAGHARGIVKRRDGAVDILEVGSPIVGAFESVQFKEGETVIDDGDALLLYTDGVTEARRGSELFGEDRLIESIRHLQPTTAQELPKAVFAEVLQFTGGQLSDDVAIVSVARKDST